VWPGHRHAIGDVHAASGGGSAWASGAEVTRNRPLGRRPGRRRPGRAVPAGRAHRRPGPGHPQQLRRVIAPASDAFVAMDENGAVTEWNAQAAATFGYASNEAIGQPLHELIIPEAQRAAPRRGAGPVPGDRRGAAAGPAPGARRPPPGRRNLPRRGQQLGPGGRRRLGLQRLVRDISERRRQQEALAESEQLLRLTR
jgi:PAS domain-containing protein